MSRYVLYRRLRFGSPLFNSFLQNPTMALISSPVFSIFIFVFNTLRYVCDFLSESDNTFLSTYTTSFFIITPHTRRMATRCYIHFEKFDYMRHSFHNIWKNIIHYEYRGKSFIYVFFKKIKVGNFPTSLVFLLCLDYPTSQLPPVLGFSYTQLSRIRSLLETIYVYVN